MIGKPVQILLADDSESDVFLVRKALQQQGFPHHLTVTHDGAEALHLLNQAEKDPRSSPPRLILLDLNLPKIDGCQILAYIRRTPAFDGTLVIVLTTSDAPRDRNLVRAMGAKYFQKPVDLRSFMQLGQVIEDTLNGRESERAE